MDPNIENPLIQKKIYYPGTKYVPLTEGTRVKFHFQTRKCDSERTVLDDSKKTNRPMELVLGKKFKLEVWEVIVQKMALNEVASFTVDKSLLVQYPFVSKTIRDATKPLEERRTHMCGMTLQNEGIGYTDLDELMKTPTDLEFIIELISVELPQDYEKDSWQMGDDEKLRYVQELKDRGNEYYKQREVKKAEESYSHAIGIIEQLMLKEKPNDVEWNELAELKVPLLLNYTQCKLLEKDYYPVITYCTEVLKYDPNNCKAYYRRAKAHSGAWNVKEAEEDYLKCVELDPKLNGMVAKELSEFKTLLHAKEREDKVRYQGLF